MVEKKLIKIKQILKADLPYVDMEYFLKKFEANCTEEMFENGNI
jgi:hypothetical protein